MTEAMITASETTEDELEAALAAADAATGQLADARPAQRAAWLRRVAEVLDTSADELVPLAQRESHLPKARLLGELARTTFQLRFFADVVDEGSYLEAMIDTADPAARPTPRPDLRRQLHPLGPVVVFGAGNFPFAFSVAGGDTAAALAAGCAVVFKVHPGHPELARRTGDLVIEALRRAGAPEGTYQLISGTDIGRRALYDQRVKAGAFTGSLDAGRSLFDLAASRPDPIPFYGELGSLNPVFVTPSAAASRGSEIVSGFVESFTAGVGQLCTKPGVLFLPAAHDMLDEIAGRIREIPAAPMLSDRTRVGYQQGLDARSTVAGVQVAVAAELAGELVAPSLLTVSAPQLLATAGALLTECFGPVSIVAEYTSTEQILKAAELLDGNLTATLHVEADDPLALSLLERLRTHAGRVICNGWPTGVSVTHSMHHGGPYPATTVASHTSVGAAAVRRFLRPVCYQNMPQPLLPEALRDENVLRVPRRIDGVITCSDVG